MDEERSHPAEPAGREGPAARVPRCRPALLALLGLSLGVATLVTGAGLQAGLRARLAGEAPHLGAGAAAPPVSSAERLEIHARLTLGIQGVSLLLAGVGFALGASGLIHRLGRRVAARRRAFGLRLGAGERRVELLLEVLAEAVAVALAAGLLGLVAGRLGALVLAGATHLPAQPPLGPALGALGLALGVGLASGLYPAYRAARQTPIEPLRQGPAAARPGRPGD